MDNVKHLESVEPKKVPEFLATLRDEHLYFQSLLDIARENQEVLKNGGEIDFDTLQEVLQYLAEYPEESHHPKEDLLMDRLRKVDRASIPIIDEMLVGHKAIHKESNRLYFNVMRTNNGEDMDLSVLSKQLDRFVVEYEKHMHAEDNIVFVRALNALSDDDWAELNDTLVEIDDPLFGTRVRRRYRNLGKVLEERLGITRQELVMAEYLSLGAIIDSLITISDTTVNISHILYDRTGLTLRENLAAAREGAKSGGIVDIAKLPFRFHKNAMANLRTGFGETKTLLSKAAEDIRTPYNMRMDALKEVLRNARST